MLSMLVRTGEINLKSYAATTGLSERTLRRYFADLREFFGAENFILTKRGNVGITDKNLLSSLTLPSEKEKLEFQKLADLLHVINPGFTEVLPPAYKRVDEKLAKELADIFLIKGSPHERPPKIGILIKLRKAIGFKKYCDITYEDETIKSAKALKIIYSKGNWQLAIIDAQNPVNNGFRIIRIKFIKEVVLQSQRAYAKIPAEYGKLLRRIRRRALYVRGCRRAGGFKIFRGEEIFFARKRLKANLKTAGAA